MLGAGHTIPIFTDIAKTLQNTRGATTLPQGRAERARELLGAAVKSTDHLLTEKPAAILGAKGAKKTAEEGLTILPKSRPCGKQDLVAGHGGIGETLGRLEPSIR